MNIGIRVERHYGAERRYVADEAQAMAITMLTGRRTVSESDIKALSFLGHSFSEVEVGRKIAPKEEK